MSAMGKRIPDDAARECTCGGTLRPDPDTAHYDADGMAMVSLYCDATGCGIESVHYWDWK